jgi:hypothetical protein
MTATRSLIPLALLLIAIAAGLMLVTLTMPAVIPNALPGHAEHDEAAVIRACAKDPANLMQVWLNSSGDRLNCLIRLPDGRIGTEVIQFSCRKLQWLEISSYIIGQGDLAAAVGVLRAKACTQVFP